VNIPAREYFESEDGRFRYVLTRDLPGKGPPLVFCMLNPSTANATQDDQTIRRCIGFANREGASMLVVVNLYAYRATSPTDLVLAGWPTGEMNDRVLRWAGGDHQRIVCAWGANAQRQRANEACLIFRDAPAELVCLGMTKDGSPRHPLYVRAGQPFMPYPTDLN
jgi:hypothetical protein